MWPSPCPGLRREDFPVPDRLTYLNRAALTALLDFPGHPAELGSAADSLGAPGKEVQDTRARPGQA